MYYLIVKLCKICLHDKFTTLINDAKNGIIIDYGNMPQIKSYNFISK